MPLVPSPSPTSLCHAAWSQWAHSAFVFPPSSAIALLCISPTSPAPGWEMAGTICKSAYLYMFRSADWLPVGPSIWFWVCLQCSPEPVATSPALCPAAPQTLHCVVAWVLCAWFYYCCCYYYYFRQLCLIYYCHLSTLLLLSLASFLLLPRNAHSFEATKTHLPGSCAFVF